MKFEALNKYLHAKFGFPNKSTEMSFPDASAEDLNEAHLAAADFMAENPDNKNHLLVQNWLNSIESHPLYVPNGQNTPESIHHEGLASPVKGGRNTRVKEEIGLAQGEAEIVALYVDPRKCWARPAYTTISIVENGIELTRWKCKICSSTFAFSKKTTANIQKHLRTQHINLYLALIRKRQVENPVESQAPIPTHLDKKVKTCHFTQKGLNEWLVKYSVFTDQSFLGVEHPVFVGLLEYCHPGITLPTRNKIRDDFMHSYKLKKESLKLKLKEVTFNSITDFFIVLYYRPLDIPFHDIIYGCYLPLHR